MIGKLRIIVDLAKQMGILTASIYSFCFVASKIKSSFGGCKDKNNCTKVKNTKVA